MENSGPLCCVSIDAAHHQDVVCLDFTTVYCRETWESVVGTALRASRPPSRQGSPTSKLTLVKACRQPCICTPNIRKSQCRAECSSSSCCCAEPQKQYADAVIEVLPTQLIPGDDECKVVRVKLIMKEGVEHFSPVHLFDEGSTVYWIPCGRKLSCSYPGIRFAYGFDTYFGHEVTNC